MCRGFSLCATWAEALPPCLPPAHLTSVGYTSPATSQVVQLGPNWFQKELKKYRNCAAGTAGSMKLAAQYAPLRHIKVGRKNPLIFTNIWLVA